MLRLTNSKRNFDIYLIILLVISLVVRWFKLAQIPDGIFIDNYNQALPSLMRHLGLASGSWLGFGWYGTPEAFFRLIEFFQDLIGFESEKFRWIWNFWGWMLIPIVYLLAKKEWGKQAALMSGFFLTFSVQHLNFSRWAHSNTVVTTLIWLGIAFWLTQKKGSEKNIWLQIFAGLAWSASIYCYVGARLYVVLLVLIVFLLSLIKKELKQSLVFFASFLVGIAPTIYAIYRYPFGFWSRSEELLPFSLSQPLSEIMPIIGQRLVAHLPLFWLGVDANVRHSPLQTPHFLWPVLFFAVFGLVALVKKQSWKILSVFAIVLLAGWLSSALSGQKISIFRAQPILPVYFLLAGYAVADLVKHIKQKVKLKKQLIFFSLGLLALLLPILNVHDYFFSGKADATNVAIFHTIFETELARQIVQEALRADYVLTAPDYYWFSSTRYELLLAKVADKVSMFEINNLPSLKEKNVTLILPNSYTWVVAYLAQLWPNSSAETLHLAGSKVIVLKTQAMTTPQTSIAGECVGSNDQKVQNSLFVPFALWSENMPMPVDKFSCQWRGKVYFPNDQRLSFLLTADDWASVRLANRQISLELDSAKQNQRDILLTAGEYQLEIEYRNDGGAKRLELLVKDSDNDWQVFDPNWINEN